MSTFRGCASRLALPRHSPQPFPHSTDGQLLAIFHAQVRCLNEAEEGLCKHVFKPWHRRLDTDGPSLRSDVEDPELLLHVPFTGAIKLQAISVIGGPDGTSPAKLKVFTNRDDLDFGVAGQAQPVQEWDLVENLAGTMEYPTQ